MKRLNRWQRDQRVQRSQIKTSAERHAVLRAAAGRVSARVAVDVRRVLRG